MVSTESNYSPCDSRGVLPIETRAQHPTVYLPSHDPESAARLAGAVTVG